MTLVINMVCYKKSYDGDMSNEKKAALSAIQDALDAAGFYVNIVSVNGESPVFDPEV